MKNKLIDLNDHLFAQLERLNDEEITGEDLSSEIERSKAITGVAGKIVDNAKLALDASDCKYILKTFIAKMYKKYPDIVEELQKHIVKNKDFAKREDEILQFFRDGGLIK